MREFSNIAGRYQVTRLVFTRDVTSTYLATDVRAGDRQVMLEVAPVGDSSPTRQSSLGGLAEIAEQVRALEHPNLAPLRGFFQDGPYYGFVKKAGEGLPLADWLESADELSKDLRISLCRDVLEGLGALHGVGVLHRDLSPRSIWISTDPEDSGSHRPVAQIDGFHRGVRSLDDFVDPEVRVFPGRVAPEINAGATYSYRSDVFAAGLVLLEILGDPSTASSSLGASEVLDEDITEEEVRRRVPAPYAEVVVRATSRSRLERFQDGLDLLAAFDAMDLERRLAGVG